MIDNVASSAELSLVNEKTLLAAALAEAAVFVPAACANAGASQFGVAGRIPGCRPMNRALRSLRRTRLDPRHTASSLYAPTTS